MTALATVLWLGQAGLQALPQLAMNLGHRTHLNQNDREGPGKSHLLENAQRSRCDIEGTRYISLLHYLAGIPQDKKLSQFRCRFSSFAASVQSQGKFRVPQFAMAALSPPLTGSDGCRMQVVEQFVCFSPAYTFIHIPRGPPNLT
jgi:hypothetical protein